ncbi:MAG: S9 family peptidase [Candidatus Heimdallarchaeota archaeon]|nr:S9 family peptidase [Candidatus Heimdallarchaeota archaeon]
MSETKYNPTIIDMLSLEVGQNVSISPNGDKVAFTTKQPNWSENFYENICYIYFIKEKRTYQLTRSGSVKQTFWLTNDNLAVLKNESEDINSKNQVYLFEGLIGEPLEITDHAKGVKEFKPFGNGILFLADDAIRAEKKQRKEKFGSLVHFEQDKSANALYYVDIARLKEYKEILKNKINDSDIQEPLPLIEVSKLLDEPLTIVNFFPSKQNDAIYLTCRLKDDMVYFNETINYKITINPEEAMKKHLVIKRIRNDEGSISDKKKIDEDNSYIGEILKFGFPLGFCSIEAVSPNGKEILISHKERDNKFYTQDDAWLLDLEKWRSILQEEKITNKLVKITSDLDRNLLSVIWTKQGIFAVIPDRTENAIMKIEKNGNSKRLALNGYIIDGRNFDISDNGILCFFGANNEMLGELFVSKNSVTDDNLTLLQITNNNQQIENWKLGSVETIHWKSKDGTEIDGILRKPIGFDAKKKYPLVLIIHGGPTWYNTERLLENEDIYTYPTIQFSGAYMLVLKVNYRGSIGRGQEFLELNKENLGIGDMWDLESAIEYLGSLGFLDTEHIGCMGWSQGGFISAFVGIHSKKFKAVSVGAGISDWYTYHISNDIPQFTTNYLSVSPFRDRDIYHKTSPISKLKEAQTPMLIQHGELDPRVPLSNAKELYRGLKEMNVPVELFIYPGMTHSISKPKENRAIMHQNLTWFNHYLLGEELIFYKED